MNREECISDLIKRMNNLTCWRQFLCGKNMVTFTGSDRPLPPYIPQIGTNYFDDDNCRRILMYAMNQNLAGAPEVVQKYSDFARENQFDKVLNRLNGEHTKGINNVRAYMGPYPHMNLFARMLISISRNGTAATYNEAIERTACTNLIKCSTSSAASTPNPEMYENCMRNTCLRELQVLQPDIVLAMSDDVFYNLSKMLDFTVLQTRGKYSIPRHGHKNGTIPKLIISVYHSTGTIAGAFKRLQRYFDEGGDHPKRFRPYIGMLTGEDYYDSPDYWNNAKTEYLKQKDFLLSTYPIFFEEKEWYGLNSNYLFYFACHLALFQRLSAKFSTH